MDLATREGQSDSSTQKVPHNTFLGVIWAGVAISGLLLACRLYARHRGSMRFFWDDVFTIASFIFALTTATLWQWAAKDGYYAIDVELGIDTIGPDFFPRLRRWLTVSLIVEMFYYTSLVLVKLSFLFFFRRLGAGVYYYRYVWWPVAVVSLIFYIVSIGSIDYKCFLWSFDFIFAECAKPEELSRITKVAIDNAVWDVASDFLTLLLPSILLWNVQMLWTKKLAILCLLSLSIITITTAIVRVATWDQTKGVHGQHDWSYFWLWSAIETSVAISVSCLSAFPQLFAPPARSNRPSFAPSDTYRGMIPRIRRGKQRKRDSWIDIPTVFRSRISGQFYGAPDLGLSAHNTQDGLLHVLAPARNITRTYARPPLSNTHGNENHITKEVGFGITRQAA
ncbi:hypothetical protein F5X98DRAFT_368689 [Xylaria grammica]|nr:hypothetical protein F5X98DRAFT_368689 [Xylaria grammica]